jgi:hypothetical protein
LGYHSTGDLGHPAIFAARDDLNPANGTYPIDALGHRDHAAIDCKVSRVHVVASRHPLPPPPLLLHAHGLQYTGHIPGVKELAGRSQTRAAARASVHTPKELAEGDR